MQAIILGGDRRNTNPTFFSCSHPSFTKPECGNLHVDHIEMLPVQASELNVQFEDFVLLFFSFSGYGVGILLSFETLF